MKIQPFVHRCVVPTGPCAGNDHWRDVTAYEADSAADCDVCGERLATPKQIALHVYEELTG